MDFFSVVGAILGVLGIVFAFVFYFKGKKKKKLVYNSESTILVSENLSSYEDLKILYNNKEIISLCSTTVKIRNIGNDIIEPDDLVPSMPITVKTSDKFLFQDVTKYECTSSNLKNRVSLERVNESEICVKFDFINPKEEITITVLHTGVISVDGDLKQGDVKNYTKTKYETAINKEDSEDSLHSNSLSVLFLKLLMITLVIIVVFVSIYISVECFFVNGNIDVNIDNNIFYVLVLSVLTPAIFGVLIMNKK